MIRRSKNFSCVIFAVVFAVCGVSIAEETQSEYSVSRLFMGKNRTYSEEEDSVERGVVLLDFFNDACGPCRSMAPAVDSLVQRGYRISKINTDKFPDWARRFNISKIPCFVVIVDGREVARHTGVTSEKNLEKLLVQAGGRAMSPHTRPGNFGSNRLVQNSESAWRGRETAVSVQDIMSGRYVFSENINGIDSAVLASSSVESAIGGNAAISESRSVSSEDRLPAQNWLPVSNENSRNRENVGVAPVRDLNFRNAENSRMNRSRILSSTVRIRVYADGEGNGTGTLIDSRSDHALILTCGHLFSEFKKGDSISVDIFTTDGVVTLPGNYVHHDPERDLGLLTLAFSGEIETSPVAGLDYELRKGMPIATCGCSNGENPTIQQGRVTHLNRYLGPSNIETSAVPVPGRSGGGMFAETGELIGVCFAADPEEQEGLFTSLSEIHAYFRSLKMERFLLEPRNESKNERNANENIIALHDLPQRNAASLNDKGTAVQNKNGMGDSFQPVSSLSSLPTDDASISSGKPRFDVPQTMDSRVPGIPSAKVQPTSQFSSSADMVGKFESIPLKKAEKDYVSLSEMNTVAPIVPSEEISSAFSNEGVKASVNLVPERTLTGEAAPAWPPRWND